MQVVQPATTSPLLSGRWVATIIGAILLLAGCFAVFSSSGQLQQKQTSTQNSAETSLDGLLKDDSFVNSFESSMTDAKQLEWNPPWKKPITGKTWQDCTNLPVLDNTCLGLYADESNLAVGGFISFQGTKIFGHPIFAANYTLQFASANTACVSETDLLKLIELIPVLVPFDPVINKIINDIGKVPAHVLSICAHLSDMDFTKKNITGDAELLVNLMCLKGHCLHKIDHDFGHFTIPL